VRPLAERKNIDLEYRIDQELNEVHQDQAKVQQILSNLLSNAVKFTPEGGHILVAASLDLSSVDSSVPESVESGSMILFVRDTGVGIADEEQQAIFEKFRQGRAFTSDDDAMTREFSGTGLGLSIVRELCRLLGGEVSLESRIGQGSTFTVRLPVTLVPQTFVPPLEAIASDGSKIIPLSSSRDVA